jgi:hypothetical protein
MGFIGLAGAIGVLIGLNWSIVALLPATAILTLGSCTVAFAPDSSLPGIILALISLQGGFMIGLTGRDVVGSFVARLNASPSKRF